MILRYEDQGIEYWVYNPNRTRKFCGKEVRVFPGKTIESVEEGAYAVFVWKGEGKIRDAKVIAGNPEMDELYVSAEAAVQTHKIVNTGREELVLYRIFGPDVYKAPIIYDSM